MHQSWLAASAAPIGVAVALMATTACGGDTASGTSEESGPPPGTTQTTEAPGSVTDSSHYPRAMVSVEGMRLTDASRFLRSLGFEFVWFLVQEHDGPPGDLVVCAQAPAEGELVLDPVRLALTRRCPLSVPDVSEKPLRVAEPQLRALHIPVGDYLDARDDDFPASITPKPSWILCSIDVMAYAWSVVQETTGDLYGHGETLSPQMFVAPTIGACSESNEPEDG